MFEHQIIPKKQSKLTARRITEKESITQFVTKKIKHRQCIKYIPDKHKTDGEYCCCGKPRRDHHTDPTADEVDSGGSWSLSTDTEDIPPSSFGTIQFVRFDSKNRIPAKYIRITPDVKIDDVWTLIQKHWRVPLPKLIISVTGGAKYLFLNEKQKKKLKRGLINAATSTGAWLVTAGTNSGVNQMVGEAVLEYAVTRESYDKPIVVFGIATWGVIDNKEALIGDENQGCFPAEYCLEMIRPEEGLVVPLDQNHSHFILVDDGTDRKHAKEIEFRAKFESFISQKKEEGGMSLSTNVNIPVVQVLIEGGLKTLHLAVTSLQQGIGIVVIQGTGRMADYIVEAMKATKDFDIASEEITFPQNFDDKFKALAKTKFDLSRFDPSKMNEVLEECVNNLKELLKRQHLIQIYNLDDSESIAEIDQAILDVLMIGQELATETQLELSLALNRCDVAREKILTSSVENRHKWQKSKEVLHKAMFDALVQNSVDFVQLFIDNGVDLEQFLSMDILRRLYEVTILDQKINVCEKFISRLLKEMETNNLRSIQCSRTYPHRLTQDILKYVGDLITDLLGKQQSKVYKAPLVKDNELPLTKPTKRQNTPDFEKNTSDVEKNTHFDNPANELFLWAILLNRTELAFIFWRLGKDHISGALIGSTLLKSLSIKAEIDDEIDLSEELATHSQCYEGYALTTLNECYIKNKETSHQLVVRELDTWGGSTLFNLANSAKHMDFMGHACCQSKLNNIWMGSMALHTQTWKILGTLFCPLLVFLIKFNNCPDDDEDEEEYMVDGNYNNTGLISPEKVNLLGGPYESQDVIPKTRGIYRVSCCGSTKKNNIPLWWALWYFYRSPVVKFYLHSIFSVIFLVLFSYLVLVSLHPDLNRSDSWIELLIWVWIASLTIEECRQIVRKDTRSYWLKLTGYIESEWNKLDTLAHLSTIIAVILRFSLPQEQFGWSRVFYCITLMIYYIRILESFYAEKTLGPKVIMIKNMLSDLMYFLVILLVFILSYGVAQQSLLYPNSHASWTLLMNVIYQPYWQMLGELDLELLEGKEDYCTNDTEKNPDLPRCTENNTTVVILFIIYIIMTNVLLLNLLIAMFRYTIVHDFFGKPILAPPLIFISHISRAIRYCLIKCRHSPRANHDFKQRLSDEENDKLTAFEKAEVEKYLYNKQIEEGAKVKKADESYATKEDIAELNSHINKLEHQLGKIVDILEQSKESKENKDKVINK